MLTHFYTIWHRLYWDIIQHKSYWFAHLTYRPNAAALPWKILFLFLSGSNVVFSGNGALKRSGFGAEMKMQTWRWTDPLQMFEVVIIGSRAGSQALSEVCHRLVDVVLWQLFQMVCKATLNSSVVSGFGWSLWYFSSTAPHKWYVTSILLDACRYCRVSYRGAVLLEDQVSRHETLAICDQFTNFRQQTTNILVGALT